MTTNDLSLNEHTRLIQKCAGMLDALQANSQLAELEEALGQIQYAAMIAKGRAEALRRWG